MHRQTSNGIAYYTFESLQIYCDLVHAISTRHGGCSNPPYDSLNLGKSVGDDARLVEMNLAAFHAALELDPKRTVSARQARADRVAVVTRADAGHLIHDVDALVTGEPDLPLLLKFADCVPILLFDPVRRVIGVVHAGWSGTVLRILTKAAGTIMETFGTRPEDLVAGIGPSIGPCCYCIGPDVIAQVKHAFAGERDLLVRREGRVYFDLWEANKRQLQQLGVSRIEVPGLCTSDHTDDFYSARAEKPTTGRFGALIGLR